MDVKLSLLLQGEKVDCCLRTDCKEHVCAYKGENNRRWKTYTLELELDQIAAIQGHASFTVITVLLSVCLDRVSDEEKNYGQEQIF
jgi:hypothetical protein